MRGRRGGVVFRVHNQGQALPPETINRVFDKFSQVGPGGSRAGSGLGLTFCRLAVDAQGGRIWAESVPGQGTLFSFTLPARPPSLSAHEVLLSEAGHTKKAGSDCSRLVMSNVPRAS